MGAAAGFALLAFLVCAGVQRKKKVKEAMLLSGSQDVSGQTIGSLYRLPDLVFCLLMLEFLFSEG